MLLLALVLGGIIGWDRERNEHPAGLRTHILVCVGSALITLVDRTIPGGGARIAAQIVTGVGFLGAGTILRDSSGSMVRGLTTAASLWTVAGIGIAVGAGGLTAGLAVIGTVIVFVTLSVLEGFEQILMRNRRRQEITFVLTAGDDPMARLVEALNTLYHLGVGMRDIQIEAIDGGQLIHILLTFPSRAVRDRVKSELEKEPAIVHVEWSR